MIVTHEVKRREKKTAINDLNLSILISKSSQDRIMLSILNSRSNHSQMKG